MAWFREHTNDVHDRRGNLVENESLKGQTGFVSVYSFDESAALAIRAQGNSRDFKRFPVHSKLLMIDLDDGDASLGSVRERLDKAGYSYTVFSSGSKGYHIYVRCEEAFSTDLPALHRHLALELAPTCDVTLYRPNSLIRLPGTIHSKTGRPKTLVAKVEGPHLLKLPKLTIIAAPELVKTEKVALYCYFKTLADAVEYPPNVGGRHNQLWKIAKDGYDAGIPKDAVLDAMSLVNNLFDEPKTDTDLEIVVNATYNKIRY